jgi:D,D-heptose 1,7-bisphosphate phosphatase
MQMNSSNKAVFLDRDGVINDLVSNTEEGIIDSPSSLKQFKLINGVGEALKQLKEMRFLLILISNQPGIAKGKYNLDEFDKIRQKLEKSLKQFGVILDGQYYCLHHPYATKLKYKKKCKCRKPQNKMILDATKDYDIDLTKSFLIGDGLVDMQLAQNSKCRGIFIGNINSATNKLFLEKKVEPHYIAHDLLEAANYIKDLEHSNL